MKNQPVTLIVWQQSDKRTRKMEYSIESHQEAVKLARNMFSGMRTKIVNKAQRRWPTKMRSYADLMQMHGSY